MCAATGNSKLHGMPFAHGAYGAKGIGELPMDGPAPAILNAVSFAAGTDFNAIPLMPEDICARLVLKTASVEAVAV